jgi:hypothetical protein
LAQVISWKSERNGASFTPSDAFIDLAFETDGIEGMTAIDVKRYIRFIADRRLIQLGLQPIYKKDAKNPLPWMDQMLGAIEHTNFFTARRSIRKHRPAGPGKRRSAEDRMADAMARSALTVDMHLTIQDHAEILIGVRQNTGFCGGLYHLPAGNL